MYIYENKKDLNLLSMLRAARSGNEVALWSRCEVLEFKPPGIVDPGMSVGLSWCDARMASSLDSATRRWCRLSCRRRVSRRGLWICAERHLLGVTGWGELS